MAEMSFDWIGQAFGGVADYFGNQEDQDFSNQTREHQENFQREMRNSSYQAAVTDLKAAGLNPMLAYRNGGASSPAGSAGGGPQSPSYANSIGQASSSASMIAVNRAQAEKLRAETSKAEAETNAVVAQTPGFAVQQRMNTATAAQTEQMVQYLTRVQGHREEKEKADYRIRHYEEAEHAARYPSVHQRANQDIEQRGANIGLTKAEIRRILAQSVLEEYQEPGARARRDSDLTGYGQNVRPYMNEAGKVIGTAVGAATGIGAAAALSRRAPFSKGSGPRRSSGRPHWVTAD